MAAPSYRPRSTGRARRSLLPARTGAFVSGASPEGKPLQTIDVGANVNDVVLSPDGSLVAAGAGRQARVWRLDPVELVATVRHMSPVNKVDFSPDGRLVVTASDDRKAKIVDLSTGRVRVLRGHKRPVVDVEFSPDGRRVLTASEDRTARLWDAQTREELHKLSGHRAELTSASFSPDGKLVVTTSRDFDGRTWDVETGEPLEVLRGHSALATDADFSPDSSHIVTAGPRTAGLWDTETGRLILFLRGHQGLLTSVSFSPDGHRVLTSSEDKSVRRYECEVCHPLDELVAIAEGRLKRMGRELKPEERQELLPRVAARLPRQQISSAPSGLLQRADRSSATGRRDR